MPTEHLYEKPKVPADTAALVIGPLSAAWKVYTTADIGQVSKDHVHLHSAMTLCMEGRAILAQRKTDLGTQYLIKAAA